MPSAANRRRALAPLAAVLVLASCADEGAAPRIGQAGSALRHGNERLEWFPVRTPTKRRYGAMAYDQARQHLVLVGGYPDGGVSREVWERDPKLGWHDRTTDVAGPVGRAGFGLAYDARRQRTVMFGGRDAAGLPFRELWEWDGYGWAAHTLETGGPAGRSGLAMAYDRAAGQSLVFGGQTYDQHRSRELWAWDGETWSDRTVADGGPSARSNSSLAYDSVRSRTVLFGGVREDATYSSETWEWDGQAWLQVALNGPHPSARRDAAMSYDEDRHRAVLFGGGTDVAQNAEVWEWDGSTWEERTPAVAGPTPRQGAQLAYDASQHSTVLVGGSQASLPLEDIWLWNGSAWTSGASLYEQPMYRQDPQTTYDSMREHVVMYGGLTVDAETLEVINLHDTWEWTPAGWALHPTTNHPTGSSFGGFAYDQARHQTVLFGGSLYNPDATFSSNAETWTYDGDEWTMKTPATVPPLRLAMSMAYDVDRERVVMFGGRIGAIYQREVWEWDGENWQERTPAVGGPTARTLTSMTYDPREHAVLLFGGTDSDGQTSDLWAWNGSVWSAREGADGVRPLATNPTLIPAPDRNSTLTITAIDPNTYGGKSQLYEWAGGVWTPLPLARAPETLREFGAAPTSAGALVFGGGSTLISDATERLTSRGAPCTSSADSTTGFCVDGVSCVSSQCAACETCADPADAGRCMPVRSQDDDSCGTAQARTCDAAGRCKLALGGVATDGAACVSGFSSDGVCCEVASCGACRTCNAAEKEISDNTGHCGTRKAGTDPQDECAEDPASTCGNDGTCDGRGDCRLHVSGTACGPVVRESARVSSSVCTGAGACIVVDSSCDGDHTLVVPGAEPTNCGAYACEGATCKSTCLSLADCASGYFCTEDRTCAPPDVGAVAPKSGCSCRVGERAPGAPWIVLMLAGAVLAARGRRRSAAGGAFAVWMAACGAEPSAPPETTRAALTGNETLAWQHIGYPQPRVWSMATYDVARRGMFLFGGISGGSSLSDIFRDQWTFDGSRWLDQTPELTGPSQRSGGAVTYDRQRGVVLLHGGGFSPELGAGSNDLWEWNGSSWLRLEPRGAVPIARYLAGFSYDEDRHRAVLFGGSNSVYLGDTWEWDGSVWTERTPPSGGPSIRAGATLTYDPVRHVSVLFGGYDDDTFLSETWEWDGTTWTDRTTAEAPSGRWLHGAAYDRDRSRLVVYAGGATVVNDEIWERDPEGAWTERTPATGGPGELLAGVLAYDETRKRTVAFGGRLENDALGETWDWDGTSWQNLTQPAQPQQRIQSAMAFDNVRQRMLLFGGYRGAAALRELWSWDGNFWTDRTTADGPSARDRPAMAANDAGAVLVFGGTPNGIDPLGDLWQLDDSTWTERSTAGGPQARWASALAYDATRARWVLFGGRNAAGALGDTWEWDGNAWTELHPLHSPSARYGSALSYDRDRQVVVAFAGKDSTQLPGRELWEWNGVDWTERTQASAGPPPPVEVKSVYDAQLHRVLYVLTPGSVFGQNNEVWAWDGSTWTHVPVDVAPNIAYDFTLGFDSTRQKVVLFGGIAQLETDPIAATGELAGRGAPCGSDAEATTGHCVDGVACEVAACAATCQSCNVVGSVGRCAPVVLAADPDTCTGVQICDATGACKGSLGQPATNPTDCASGFLVDGVCCETASCGTCSTCSAAQKEIGDNDGRCGTQRAGTDLHDDCVATPPETCGQDGACDGRGACESFARGTVCAPNAICSGGGECVVQTAVCDGEGAVRAPSGKVASCAGFRCAEGACRTSCADLADCVTGSVCSPEGRCVPESNEAGDEPGCACDLPGGLVPGWPVGAALLCALAALRRRRRRMMESGEICP